MKTWLILGLAILSEVTATLSLRQVIGHWVWLIPIILGYSSSFACLSVLLRSGANIGVIYGVWAACGMALTSVFAAFIFGDKMTWMMVLGIIIIIVGVFFVEMGSHSLQKASKSDANKEHV